MPCSRHTVRMYSWVGNDSPGITTQVEQEAAIASSASTASPMARTPARSALPAAA